MIAGDCFQVALRTAQQMGGHVVHGLPVGRGPFNNGKRYWHAWCECNGLVYDLANDKRFVMPVTIYYRKGKIEPQYMRRYSRTEAAILALEHESYGPWDEELERFREI